MRFLSFHCVITSVVVLYCVVPTQADEGDSLWYRTFGGSSADYAYSITETGDNGFLLAGATHSFGAGNWDMWLVKTNSNGDSIWSRTFGGGSDEFAFSVIQDGSSYLLGGWTSSFGAGESDMWLVKTDLNGDSIWSHTYGGNNSDYAFSLINTSDGGYLLAGYTSSFAGNTNGALLVKTDMNGDSIWSRVFGGEGWDIAYSVIETSTGDYLFAGYTSSYGSGGYDFWLMKVDSNCDSIWSRTFGGSGDDEAKCVIETSDGGYLLAGYTKSFSTSINDYDMWLVKTDSYGDSIWSVAFGGAGDDHASSVIETGNNGYLLAGWTNSFGAGGWDIWLVQTDSTGDSLWSQTIGGIEVDCGYSVLETNNGYYMVAGETHSFGAGGWDMCLVCLEGSQTAVEFHPLSQPIGFKLYPVFPNPFNPITAIHFALPVAEQINLAIYDINGRLVATLVKGWREAGYHEITFDGSALASGVYIYRLNAGRYKANGKMVLMK